MPRPALAVVLFALALPSCNVRRVPPRPPVMMPPVAYGLDPRAADLLERCDAALRAHTTLPSAPRADALAVLSRQRLLLVMTLDELRKQTAALELRVIKARQGLRTQAQSELERALIAEALIDLDEGREPVRPLGKRLHNREEFRDAVEAHTLLRQNREKRAKIEAQVDALDATFAQLATTDGQPILMPLGAPPGRPIEPKL